MEAVLHMVQSCLVVAVAREALEVLEQDLSMVEAAAIQEALDLQLEEEVVVLEVLGLLMAEAGEERNLRKSSREKAVVVLEEVLPSLLSVMTVEVEAACLLQDLQ